MFIGSTTYIYIYLLDLQVTKEYGNKHDKYACLIWVPELELIPHNMWQIPKEEKE